MYRVAKDHVSQCESIPFAEADACYFMLNVKSGVFNDSRMLKPLSDKWLCKVRENRIFASPLRAR